MLGRFDLPLCILCSGGVPFYLVQVEEQCEHLAHLSSLLCYDVILTLLPSDNIWSQGYFLVWWGWIVILLSIKAVFRGTVVRRGHWVLWTLKSGCLSDLLCAASLNEWENYFALSCNIMLGTNHCRQDQIGLLAWQPVLCLLQSKKPAPICWVLQSMLC